jgi:hypothetical protein
LVSRNETCVLAAATRRSQAAIKAGSDAPAVHGSHEHYTSGFSHGIAAALHLPDFVIQFFAAFAGLFLKNRPELRKHHLEIKPDAEVVSACCHHCCPYLGIGVEFSYHKG